MKILALFVFLFFTSVGSAETTVDDVLSGKVLKKNMSVSNARLNIIQSISMSVGIYYGRKEQIEAFNSHLSENGRMLDRFNFHPLMIAENMLPPVVTEIDEVYEREDATHHREVQKMFRITKNANLVYDVPTWRTYINLVTDETPPVIPTDFKLENSEEKSTWEVYARLGIEAGKQQAIDEFEYQVSLMIRDYKGMLLAKHLYELGIISFSKQETLSRGIIVTDKEVNINDVLVNSSDDDKFNDASQWKAMITKPSIKMSEQQINVPIINIHGEIK